MQQTSLFKYCLHLGDNALILAQRNSEWCAHGPVLEQDIAITNISLDLLGQARNFYQQAAGVYNAWKTEEQHIVDELIPRLWKSYNRELAEDDLAFLREERQYLNLLLCELLKGDWAVTTLRQFFFSTYQQLALEHLIHLEHSGLIAIAEKALKEVRYHVRWSSEWVVRLGDGTEESHYRLQKALDELWPFTGELFGPSEYEKTFIADSEVLRKKWMQKIRDVFAEATLSVPEHGGTQAGGKEGRHTEYLGYLLAEMQHMQRTYPNLTW